jgi:cytochrome c553
MPGSNAGWTLTQLQDFFSAADWHPDEHPHMPEVVAHGRKPDVFACGFCHRADGPGGPENASLAGLPQAYIVQQMADFKSGARKGSEPKRQPTARMAALARAATDEEVASAAAYFSSLKPRKLITVTETDSVPKTYVAGWFLAPVNNGDREPIGNRIIEMPKDVEQFESRDTHSEFIAYAPPGSIARGESLATTGGNGKKMPRTGFARSRGGSGICRTFTELLGPATLRLSAWRARGCWEWADEGCCNYAEWGGFPFAGSVRGFPAAIASRIERHLR